MTSRARAERRHPSPPATVPCPCRICNPPCDARIIPDVIAADYRCADCRADQHNGQDDDEEWWRILL